MSASTLINRIINGFIAGFIATLIFHQGLVAVLHALQILPFAAYDMTPTRPLAVPAVISLAFWGGIWGIVLALLTRYASRGAGYWLIVIIIGAFGPTLVFLYIIAPLKAMVIPAEQLMGFMLIGLLLNGWWGLGCGLLMKILPFGK